MTQNDVRQFDDISASELTGRETVLTVNVRLARWLLLQYNRKKKLAGEKIWVTPPIHSLDSWARDAWLSAWPEKHILNQTQSLKIWEDIIRRKHGRESPDLLHLRGAAQQAGKAYALIAQYRLPRSAAEFSATGETQAFHGWMSAYERRLRELNAIDPADILDELREVQESGGPPLPQEIVFAGFDDIDPQLRDWIEFLKTRNVGVRFLPQYPGQPPGKLQELAGDRSVHIRKYEDRTEEVVQCARWIRSVHRPGKTIGVVVPQLEDYRSLIKREFSAELAPGSVFPWNEGELPFNISLGTPLRNEPAAHLALLILSAPGGPLPFKTFYAVLASPFLSGGKTEIAGRMELDKKLRNNNAVKIFLNQVCGPEQQEKIPDLAKAAKMWQEFISDGDAALPSVWAKKVSVFLTQIGWPFGDDEKSSALYPLLAKWNECLDALASLDQIAGNIKRLAAINALDQIAETPFTKKSPEEPIQVVGLLESSGLEFDRLWVMGCHLDNLPSSPSPNPFIPMSLQNSRGLPHSNAERELKFAGQILARLLTSSPETIFSYPAWEKQSAMTLSPLLLPLAEQESPPLIEVSHTAADQIKNAADMETWVDPVCLPIGKEELAGVKGGQTVLANMAECPFKAFAIHRLHTKKLEEPEIDIDAAQRGSLVHKAMELFWKDVQSHSALIKLDNEDELTSRVRKHAAAAIEQSQINFRRQSRFAEMETERIVYLVLVWLLNDIERSPFRVLSAEKKIDLDISGLKLRLKADRIDETEEGETIIIDYKTRAPSLSDWYKERLTQPQLPLYSLRNPAAAIAFAVINKAKCEYKGVAEKANIITGLDTEQYKKKSDCANWEELMEYWRENLHGLANAFIAGQLPADPVDNNTACKYCGHQSLCRIGEQGSWQDEEDQDD